MKLCIAFTRLIAAVLLGLSLILSACSKAPSVTPVPPKETSAPLPTLSLDETSVKDFAVTDFGAVHSSLNGDANRFLIYGSIPIAKPAADLPPQLAAFLGRWEGYSYAPPVKKDLKIVLVVQEITRQGGKLYVWSGTNLQYPNRVAEFHFRTILGDTPTIEMEFPWTDGSKLVASFSYDRQKDVLTGSTKGLTSDAYEGPYELTRERTFSIYKDYAQCLASKRIQAKTYQNETLARYGKGYLLYLPEGYEADANRAWPLIFFLHGSGDRGDNLFLLAKASPFMFIREKGRLPAIIAAPLLKADAQYSAFPMEYLDGTLAEIRASYRVDPRQIYVTGLSLGGEATWRFALHQPETFAAIAPLSAFLLGADREAMKSIKAVPVWAIHGANDTIIPVAMGQNPVNELEAAGGSVRFTVLAGHDHDVWDDTYSDSAFYDWLFQHKRP